MSSEGRCLGHLVVSSHPVEGPWALLGATCGPRLLRTLWRRCCAGSLWPYTVEKENIVTTTKDKSVALKYLIPGTWDIARGHSACLARPRSEFESQHQKTTKKTEKRKLCFLSEITLLTFWYKFFPWKVYLHKSLNRM